MKKYLLFALFLSTQLRAEYLPFAVPMKPMESTSQRKFYKGDVIFEVKVTKDEELYVSPESNLDITKRLFKARKGSFVVYEPATHKFVVVPENFAAYLAPDKTVHIASYDDRVVFSKTSVPSALGPGQFKFEDGRARLTVVDITHHMALLIVDGEAMLVKRAEHPQLNTKKLLSAADIEARMFDPHYIDPNEPVFATREDAMNNRNPIYPNGNGPGGNGDQGEIKELSSLPPPPPFPAGVPALRGSLYKGEFDIFDKDEAFLIAYEIELAARARFSDQRLALGLESPPASLPIEQENPPLALESPPASMPPPPPEALRQEAHAEPLVPPTELPPPRVGANIKRYEKERPNIKESYGYLQMVKADENRAYAYAYRVLLGHREDLTYLEKEKALVEHPLFNEFVTLYAAAFRHAGVAMPPRKFTEITGIYANGESDHSYLNALEGLAIDLIKRKHPKFWKKFEAASQPPETDTQLSKVQDQ